jgi:hypothetical protein
MTAWSPSPILVTLVPEISGFLGRKIKHNNIESIFKHKYLLLQVQHTRNAKIKTTPIINSVITKGV